MIIEYNKLVRDKIPDIIRADGKLPYTHQVSGFELETALEKKFGEEISEFRKSKTLEKLADILEVVEASIRIGKLQPLDRNRVYDVASNYGMNIKELERTRIKKAEERGSFDLGIILEYVES